MPPNSGVAFCAAIYLGSIWYASRLSEFRYEHAKELIELKCSLLQELIEADIIPDTADIHDCFKELQAHINEEVNGKTDATVMFVIATVLACLTVIWVFASSHPESHLSGATPLTTQAFAIKGPYSVAAVGNVSAAKAYVGFDDGVTAHYDQVAAQQLRTSLLQQRWDAYSPLQPLPARYAPSIPVAPPPSSAPPKTPSDSPPTSFPSGLFTSHPPL